MSLNTYLFIASLWIIYLLVHSALASGKVKRWVSDKLHVGPTWYRLIYTIISIVGIGFVLMQMAVAEKQVLFTSPGWLKYGAMILASWGVILVVVSFRHLSGLSFLGLKREESTHLVRTGVHGHVRHPIYSGTILILIGMFFYHPTDIVLVSDLIIFLYLPFGIKWEEDKLMDLFGAAYEQYREEVPALIPRPKK